jgi:hypothetical protein
LRPRETFWCNIYRQDAEISVDILSTHGDTKKASGDADGPAETTAGLGVEVLLHTGQTTSGGTIQDMNVVNHWRRQN